MKKNKDDLDWFFKRLYKRVRSRGKIDTIRQQAKQGKKVKIRYKKDDGSVTERLVSPYEIKHHKKTGRYMLYATDNKDGGKQIKSFAIYNIVKTNPSHKTYSPNWDVLPRSMRPEPIFKKSKKKR